VSAAPRVVDGELVLDIVGAVAGLSVSSAVRLVAPSRRRLVARVTTRVQGEVSLDARPDEAFKVVMLSSMRVSPHLWDSSSAYAGRGRWSLPTRGWIVQPPVTARVFGLRGGTSEWKANAPTVKITLDRPLPVGGWVTPSDDPDDDNVGMWAGTDTVLRSWGLSITVAPGLARTPIGRARRPASFR
jgi:hypothetical protein